MFNTKYKAPTVAVMEYNTPTVLICTKALIKMAQYVANCSKEIGWLGTATRNKSKVVVHEVYLFAQEVDATNTEIDAEALCEFGAEILQQENGVDIWNNIRMWGHSHVNMLTTPSGQDADSMDELAQGDPGWFLRIICNKHGDLRVDLFDYDAGVIYNNVPWQELYEGENADHIGEINKLYKLIESNKSKLSKGLSPLIKDEMLEKVRYTKVVPITKYNAYGSESSYKSSYGSSYGSKSSYKPGSKWNQDKQTWEEVNNAVSTEIIEKKDAAVDEEEAEWEYLNASNREDAPITSNNVYIAVYTNLAQEDFEELYDIEDVADFEDALWSLGWKRMSGWTDQELYLIQTVVHEEYEELIMTGGLA